ncbi:MAG: peroxiredoxin [Phenylobacterium sp.]|jgi:peroxiredoxin
MSRLVTATLLLLFSSFIYATEAVPTYQAAMDEMAAKWKKSDKPSPLTDEDRATMKSFNAYLAKTMPNPGIQVGQKAPNFTLKNAFGHTITLADELKKGPVVLVFYRGSWCPYCNLHLHVLQKAKPEFEKYGAQIIAVTPQTPDRSAAQIKKDGYPFEVLSDSDSQVMKDYQLFFKLSDDLMAIYKKFDINLEAYNGQGRNVLPVPGGFVIDSSGTVVAMEAQTDYKSRIEPATIIAALKKIK